jgi:hypothetical protein
VVSSVAPPQITNVGLGDLTNFVITATGGVPNGQFRILTETDLTVPLTNWAILSTNTWDASGNGVITYPINLAEPYRFFVIIQP